VKYPPRVRRVSMRHDESMAQAGLKNRMSPVFTLTWTVQCDLSTFSRALSAGLPQRAIHRLVDR